MLLLFLLLLLLLCLVEHLASSYQYCVTRIHSDEIIYLKMGLNFATGSHICYWLLRSE